MLQTTPVPRFTRHFTAAEFACPCCGYLVASAGLASLLDALETIRAQVNRPVRIVSGYRCPPHNRAVGGAANSRHMHGDAADVYVEGVTPAQLRAIVIKHCPEIHGIGVGQTKFHIDARPGPLTEWVYR